MKITQQSIAQFFQIVSFILLRNLPFFSSKARIRLPTKGRKRVVKYINRFLVGKVTKMHLGRKSKRK